MSLSRLWCRDNVQPTDAGITEVLWKGLLARDTVEATTDVLGSLAGFYVEYRSAQTNMMPLIVLVHGLLRGLDLFAIGSTEQKCTYPFVVCCVVSAPCPFCVPHRV
jgi:hypothetical protein